MMNISSQTRNRLILGLLPGLALCGGLILYAMQLRPPTYLVPRLSRDWVEPKSPDGYYKSFRLEADKLIGETEPWPHKHPRANSYLLSRQRFEGDVTVTMKMRLLRRHFPQSRYVGCYLCYDPEIGNGYWLSTGHAEGKYPNQCYIKIVRHHEWETIARAPYDLTADHLYTVVYARKGDQLSLAIDGHPVVTATIPPDDLLADGHVQIRLHNTEVEIESISVTGKSRHITYP